jgi:ribosomal protein S18 acetylase RimI-like enzyme
MLDVRAVEPGEGSALRDLRLRALREAPHAFAQPLASAENESVSRWEERIAASQRGDEIRLVATADGQFIGFAAGVPFGERIRVISVWVSPTYRQQGVGARLVAAVADWAAERGLDCQIEVTPGNDRAFALYERLGFVATVEPPPDGCDVVLVRRARR